MGWWKIEQPKRYVGLIILFGPKLYAIVMADIWTLIGMIVVECFVMFHRDPA